jgi:Flp pilus assembly protein TadG
MSRLRLRGERGQSAVEFALCATVFFMIVFGIFKMATLYGDYVALQHAARDGVRIGSVTRGTGNANQTAVTTAVTAEVKNSAGTLDPASMGITVTGLDSHVSPNGTLWEAHDRVKVTVTYPWSVNVMGLSLGSGTLTTTTQAIIE